MRREMLRLCVVFPMTMALMSGQGIGQQDEESAKARRELEVESQQCEQKLNQTYRDLLPRFNETGKGLFRSMQRTWVAFKILDFKVYSNLTLGINEETRMMSYIPLETSAQTLALGELVSGRDRPANEEHYPGEPVPPKNSMEADRLLNFNYLICLDLLPAEQQGPFKEAQALWIKFRDEYVRIYSLFHGQNTADETLKVITVRRVEQLAFYARVMLKRELPGDNKARSIYDEEVTLWSIEDASAPDIFRFAR